MKSFLEYVAEDILRKNGNDLSDVVVVFPNKRAALFLNENLVKLSDQPIWAPKYITISELFRHHSQLKVADPIKLICDLHKTFVECTGIEETLDHFYGWGQLLVSDFDDVDKNMADAKQLFSNLTDIHELDDVSYLTEEQKKMIQKFFSNFSEDHNSELKKRFLQLWSHFYDIYTSYNRHLQEQGLAYEGALYRKVVQDESIHFEHKKYLFVGFNMMQTVELKLADRLQKEGKAFFYWDFDRYYMDGINEAGHYIRQYLKYYPNELGNEAQTEIYDNFSHPRKITYISAPTENIQGRYVYDWLMENDRYKEGKNVAIVLADEGLLQTVINSLPDEVDGNLNITLGYPLQQTPFYSLVLQLIKLQGIGHTQHSDTYRLHYVLLALRHPYMRYVSERYADLLQKLEDQKQFYPSREYLCLDEDEGLNLLFRDLDTAANKEEYNKRLMQYLLDVLKLIGTHSKDLDDPFFQESLFRTYTLLNRLHGLIDSGDLQVDVITLERLIQQVITTTTIPFHGEPAVGIQIMGVLETRNLDFDHTLVLSCNEGKLPKGVNDSSFIPYSLRKAYGLTTIDHKVSIFAYHFYSMLQRASDITLTYNNATEDGQTGEMSRFMLQMMVESPHRITRRMMVAGQKLQRTMHTSRPKAADELQILLEKSMLTPTFINVYLKCPMMFYFKYIEGLNVLEEIDEDEVDNRVFGNIFHRASELLYLSFAQPEDLAVDAAGNAKLVRTLRISPDALDEILKDKLLVECFVDQAFKEELFKIGRNEHLPQYNGLQRINREVIAYYLRQLITIDRRMAPFYIKGLELKVTTQIPIMTHQGVKPITIGGFIDRLDAVAANGNPGANNLAERIRVIDYKTGRTRTSHPSEIEEVFSSETKALNKHTDYYLQSMLYSIVVKNDARLNPAHEPVSPGLLFIQSAGAEAYDPMLKMGKEAITDIEVYEQEFMDRLKAILEEIFNLQVPYLPTQDAKRCATCPYVALCR